MMTVVLPNENSITNTGYVGGKSVENTERQAEMALVLLH